MGSAFAKIAPKDDDDSDKNSDDSDSQATTVSTVVPEGAYKDPPIPTMGQPVNFDLLVDRNKNVKLALDTMMAYVNKDIDRSIKAAETIPVSHDTERVIVQKNTMDYMAKARTIKEARDNVKKNFEQVHRALVYRKSSLEMMNANYAKKVVRKVDKVDLRETRSILDAK